MALPKAFKWVLAGALVLSACAEREVILAGKREDLRAVLVEDAPDPEQVNISAPISLGAIKTNTSWPQSVGTPSFRTNNAALAANPSLIWSVDIGAGDSRRQRITADPVVGGGAIFTLDASARVTAVSTSGAVLWSQDLTPPNDGAEQATGGGLAFADGRIYVTLGFGSVSALDAASGDVIWTQQLDATSSGAPTVFGDLVYLVSGDDTGWAINKDSGRVEWQIGGSQSISNVLGAPAPAIDNGLAIFAFGSGDVQAVFRQGGLRRWDASVVGERRGRALATIGDITGTPVIDQGRVYIGNQSGRIVALNAAGGGRIWTAKEGAIGPVWPAGNSVFALTDLNELVRLSAEDGTRIWAAKLPNFIKDRPRRKSAVFAHHGPVVAGGRILVASNDGQLRSFNPEDGSLIGTVEIPNGATTAPVIAGGTLYLVNTSGTLLAFR